MDVVEYLKTQLRQHITTVDAECQTDPIQPVRVPVVDIDQHREAILEHIAESPTGTNANYLLNVMRDRITFMPQALQPKVQKRGPLKYRPNQKPSPTKPMRIPNDLLDDVHTLIKKRKLKSDANERSHILMRQFASTAVDDESDSSDDLSSPQPSITSDHGLNTLSSSKILVDLQNENDERVREDEEIEILNEFSQSLRHENITKAVRHCLECDERGEPFTLAAVARSHHIPRSTLKREYEKAVNGLDVDGAVKLKCNGKPDMRCLRQILLRRHVQQHGGDVIIASNYFKGITTSEMLEQLSPEEKAQLKPIMPDDSLDQ